MKKLMTFAAVAAFAACAAHAGSIDWEALGATYADGTPIKNGDSLCVALTGAVLAVPWEGYARKLAALFADDDEVTVTPDFRADERRIRVYVTNAAKAGALAKLLPAEVAFGNVTVAVSVVPGNGAESPVALLRTAFRGYPNFADALELRPGTGGRWCGRTRGGRGSSRCQRTCASAGRRRRRSPGLCG